MDRTRSRHDHFAHSAASRCAAETLAARWRAEDASPDAPLAPLTRMALGAPAADELADLLGRLVGSAWLAARLDAALALLAADPFARPPVRSVGGGDGACGLILAEQGAVRLSLQLHRFGSAPAAAAAIFFVPGAAAFHVLSAGGALFQQYEVAVSAAEEAGAFTAKGAAPCHSQPPRPLAAGEGFALDTARASFSLTRASGDIVLLELAAQPPSPLPVRAYDPASGRLLHVAASRRDSSFRTMALTLLRHMGRRDAASLFAEAAQADDFAGRWLAMREYCALDPVAARPTLIRMAEGDPHPEVRRAAAATLALLSPPEGPSCRS